VAEISLRFYIFCDPIISTCTRRRGRFTDMLLCCPSITDNSMACRDGAGDGGSCTQASYDSNEGWRVSFSFNVHGEWGDTAALLLRRKDAPGEIH
jgi:hypothetical protein